jgi:sulfite reductase alpha subunit-like flavoprotein
LRTPKLIELPEGMTYLPGSCLQGLTTNATENVQRALTYFSLDKDDFIIIKKGAGYVRAQFPIDGLASAQKVLQRYQHQETQ